MEGCSYSQPFVYKYYHFPDAGVLERFLSRPTLKFTHNDDLNDPFRELSRRWTKFGYPFTAGIFERRVTSKIGAATLGYSKCRERDFWKIRGREGLCLSRQERRKIVATKIKRAHIEPEIESSMEHMRTLERLLPLVVTGFESEFVVKFSKTSGILSLTEDAKNDRMWQEYASDGRGFVLKFDAKHPFFFYREKGRKVRPL